jgi:hypothetical protein
MLYRCPWNCTPAESKRGGPTPDVELPPWSAARARAGRPDSAGRKASFFLTARRRGSSFSGVIRALWMILLLGSPCCFAASSGPFLVVRGTGVEYGPRAPVVPNEKGELSMEPEFHLACEGVFQGDRYVLWARTQTDPSVPRLAHLPPGIKLGTVSVQDIYGDPTNTFVVEEGLTMTGEPVHTQVLAYAGPYPSRVADWVGLVWLICTHQTRPLSELPKLLSVHRALSTHIEPDFSTNTWFEWAPAPNATQAANIRWYRPGYLIDARGRRHDQGPTYAKGVLTAGLFLRDQQGSPDGVITQRWDFETYIETRKIAHRDDVAALTRTTLQLVLERKADPSLEARIVPPGLPGVVQVLDYRYEDITKEAFIYQVTNQWLPRDHPKVQSLARAMASAQGQLPPQQSRTALLGRLLLVAVALSLPAVLLYRRITRRT